MSNIEVTPATLSETADRLRAASLDARRLRQDFSAAGPGVTGDAGLSDALGEHAEAWGWFLDRLHERVRDVARALDAGAAAYEQMEREIADAAQR